MIDRLQAVAWRVDRAAVTIATMCVVAHLGHLAVFRSVAFLLPVVLAVASCSFVARVLHRKPLPIGVAAVGYTVGLFVGGTLLSQWPPGPSSASGFWTGLTTGWADLLSAQVPVDLSTAISALLFGSAWVTTAVAFELELRSRHAGIALLGALLGLVFTSLLSTEARAIALVQGPLLVGLTLVLTSIRRSQREQTLGLTKTRRSFAGRARWLAPLGLIVGIGMVGSAAAPALPGATSDNRFDLRDLQENPWDPLEEPSPLATLKALLKEGAEGANEPLFSVEAATPITRWTLAVMSTYDGVVWQVADPFGDAPAQFVPVDSALPEDPVASDQRDGTSRVEARVTIADLRGPWVPHVGRVSELVGAEGTDLRLNLETWTVADPLGVQAGQSFDVAGWTHANAGPGGIGAIGFDGEIDSAADLTLVPGNITSLAADRLQGVAPGGPQMAEIRSLFVQEGFYDISAMTPPGHSYADMAEFLENRDRLVGFEEQYAATASVLARVAGIPARVAVGFLIPAERYEGDIAEVRPADATAWVEMHVEDVGWIPVDVTPDRSREPTDETPGTIQRPIAVPNEPPPPPPPFESDPLDELEEDDEIDEDEDEEEVVIEDKSLLDRMLESPGLVALGVGAFPIAAFLMLGLVVAAIKAVRRRQRMVSGSTRRRTISAWIQLAETYEEAGYELPPNATPRELAERMIETRAVDDGARVRDLAAAASQGLFAPVEPDERFVDEAWMMSDDASAEVVESLGVADRVRMRCDPRPLLPSRRRKVTV